MRLTFDDFTRRTAAALDRRLLLGALSGVLLTAGWSPGASQAKKKKAKAGKACKKRGRQCRLEFLENCRDDDVANSDACSAAINRCCQQATTCKVKSVDQIFDKCADVLCEFKELC